MSRCRFVTGPPGIGKTTAVLRAAERLRSQGLSVGGFVTLERREGSRRTGFLVQDLASGERALLAELGSEGTRVGRYRLVPEGLALARAALLRALAETDAVALDEVGPMELKDADLREAIAAALSAEKPLFGSVHARVPDPLAERVRSQCALLVLGHENRDRAPEWLARVVEEEHDGGA